MPLLSALFEKHSPDININLIPRDPFFDTFIGAALRWALSVGRYIVIFTELFVILSFAARFSLDRQVTDLNDALFQKEQIIKSYGGLETEVRAAQFKLDQHQQISQQTNLSEVFPALNQVIPTGVKMKELIIRPDSVTMGGQALSQNALNTLINNVQLSTQFHTVSVDRIEIGDSQEPGFSFRMTAQTRPTPDVTTKTTTKNQK